MTMNAKALSAMQKAATAAWHEDQPFTAGNDGLMALALLQHRENYDLWHEEDKARDPGATDASIAMVKRAIDGFNQRRNDLVEQLDTMLLEAWGTQNEDAPLHSETAGLMIDRLSILDLKCFHTALEARRESATDAHRQKNAARLTVLEDQRADLTACLDALASEVISGRRRVKLYRQMKMYNDPDLNPVLYGRKPGSGALI